MDKEKLLKKYKIITMVEWCFLCIWWFVFKIIHHAKGSFYSLNNLIMWFVLLVVAAFIFNKLKPEERRIMPLVISIHDTVESFKKQKVVFNALAFLFLVIGSIAYRRLENIIILAIESLWILFLCFSGFTHKKLKYLQEKPEGLNF